MTLKEFTPEELVSLRQNKYVKGATCMRIRFTVEFKEKFWAQYENGHSPISILKELGFDPEVLGTSRVQGLARHIQEQVDSELGIRDMNVRQFMRRDPNEPIPPSQAMRFMQHQMNYMQQELEYIKKIILLDKEAARKCSSIQNQKPNSK